MKVIVTKDMFGVTVWKEDAEIEYRRPFGNRGTEVWLANTFFQSWSEVFSCKKVAKLFPKLGSSMVEGDKREATLNIKLR